MKYWSKERILKEISNTPLEYLSSRGARKNNRAWNLYRAGIAEFGDWRLALKEAGIDPSTVYQRRFHTKKTIVEEIRAIPPNERSSVAIRLHPDRGRLLSAARRLFPGGWEGALRAARLDPNKIRKTTRACSAEEILEYIEKRKNNNLSLRPREILKEKEGRRVYKAALSPTWRETWLSRYIGWLGAVEEAGYNLAEEGIMVQNSHINMVRIT